jgi:hypothetical protein
MLKRIGLAALLWVATNAWADAGASLKLLDIRATVLNPDGSLLTVLYDGVPAESFFSVYAKDGTSQSLIVSPFSVSYMLSDRQVLQLSMSYEYTVFDTGQLVPFHPGGFEPGNSDVPCFETNVTSPFEFGYARLGVIPARFTNCPRAPQPSAGFYLSGGWHQHISGRDAAADFTDAATVAGAQSYFVLSEVFFLPGGTFLPTDSVDIELYAQGGPVPVPVPEPESWALLLGGLAVLGLHRRRAQSTR